MAYESQYSTLIEEALKEENAQIAKFILVRCFYVFSSLSYNIQERDKNKRAVMNRRIYWNVLGSAMGIVDVGETDEERQS